MHFFAGKYQLILTTNCFIENDISPPFVTTSHFKSAFVHTFDIIEL